MVRCFLIHTVCEVRALAPTESRVLYARVTSVRPQSLLIQREQLALIARHVHTAYRLWREVCGGQQTTEAVVGEEAAALQEAHSGVLRLAAGDPFPQPCCVLWLAVHSLAFTLLCEPHENLLLGQSVLRSLARCALENLRLLGPGTEVLLRSERMEAVLHRMLPHGQLLFLNHRFALSLEKDLHSMTK